MSLYGGNDGGVTTVRVMLCRERPAPGPLAIDYLGLVAGRMSAEERSRMGIEYRRLAGQSDAGDATEETETR